MIVADASAIVEVLTAGAPSHALVVRLAEGPMHVPHLLDVEVLHSLRGLESRRAIDRTAAAQAYDNFCDLHMVRYPHVALRRRVWELRNNLSAYDAAYVALAESLELPLVTVDRRLARARGHGAMIEAYDRS